jgi:3-oxoacyl-[acyl-carrier protein] reductase
MQTELKNKIAIVTGSYGDIGNAICEKLASNGIKIALLGRNLEKLKSQKSRLLEKNKTEIIILNVDVSDLDSYKNAVDSVITKWGKIDILINNAGITKDNIIIRMSNEEWEDVININLKGTFIGCKLVSKFMVKQKYGKIINISSVVGKTGNKGQANYVASKAGIDGITKTLSKELGSRGINVNSIAPGYIETSMTNSLSEKIKNELFNKISLNRFGKPQEVASLVNFLISEEASYITGQIISLDGGMLT